jgi:propionyl-CoA synthetase
MTGRYEQETTRALTDPEGFWGEQAERVHWTKRWDRVLDDSNPPFYRWFPGGELNTCYNALDRHVEDGRGDQAALIYDSPVTDTITHFSYREFRDLVAVFAGALAAQGVRKGDRVLIYMPMVPQAVIAMLATARLGAVHSVVFGGFAANELAIRIDDAKPVVVVAGSCGIEPGRLVAYKPLLDEAIDIATHKPSRCIVFQRPQLEADLVAGRDVTWADAVTDAAPHDCVPVAATDPLYILYTSGTTGVPKGIVRDNGGHLVALSYSMKAIYDVEPGDVFWSGSDVGWIVGHSYIVYAPLFHGCTTVLYEGKPVGTPDAGAFWRVIAEHKVKVLFTAPTAFRAIRRDDPKAELMAKYDMSAFKYLFLAGERLDPDTLEWAEAQLGVPVIDHWWQTETGWPICSDMAGLELVPVKPGSSTFPVPGYEVHVLDDSGNPVARGKTGALAIKLPLPPSCLSTLWHNDQGYIDSYLTEFPGYYQSGDAGYIDDDGYVFVMSRTDDIINVAGHRLSTGGMEEVLARHADVAECAVIGVADQLKGELPLGMMVLQAGINRPPEEIVAEVVQMVRDGIGPVAAFKIAMVVKRLPKTRSGKILRGTMKKIADGTEWKMPATVDDPVIFDEIADDLKTVGYPRA